MFSQEFYTYMTVYFVIAIVCFFVSLYIIRAIFNIPTIVRYHKAQIRLLEEIAKNQGVDGAKVSSIISESQGWESSEGSGHPLTKF